MHEDTIMLDTTREVSCRNGENRCLRVDAALVDSDGRNGDYLRPHIISVDFSGSYGVYLVLASYGKCMTESSCENVNCSTMFGFADATEIITCKAACCASDHCNDFPLGLTPPSGEFSRKIQEYFLVFACFLRVSVS